MTHDRCRRATWSSDVRVHAWSGQWTCYHCGEALAIGSSGGADLRQELVPMPNRRDGLATFGLRPARYRSGQQPSEARTYRGIIPIPIGVYCPRPGICGRFQHLH